MTYIVDPKKFSQFDDSGTGILTNRRLQTRARGTADSYDQREAKDSS